MYVYVLYINILYVHEEQIQEPEADFALSCLYKYVQVLQQQHFTLYVCVLFMKQASPTTSCTTVQRLGAKRVGN